jgi:uncharacterized protein YdaT
MPWSYPNNLPPSVANKTEEQKKKFVEVANTALSKGRSETEAVLAGMMAIKTHTVTKKVLRTEEQQSIPSHLQIVVNRQKQEVLQEVEKVTTNPSEIKSLVFDAENKLVITLQNGKKFTSNPVQADLIESFTSISNGSATAATRLVDLTDVDTSTLQDGYSLVYSAVENKFYFAAVTGGGQPNNLKHYDTVLSGFQVEITNLELKFNEIVAVYFTKNGKNVEVLWEFTTNKHLIIDSNFDLSGIQLVAHGK